MNMDTLLTSVLKLVLPENIKKTTYIQSYRCSYGQQKYHSGGRATGARKNSVPLSLSQIQLQHAILRWVGFPRHRKSGFFIVIFFPHKSGFLKKFVENK